MVMAGTSYKILVDHAIAVGNNFTEVVLNVVLRNNTVAAMYKYGVVIEVAISPNRRLTSIPEYAEIHLDRFEVYSHQQGC